jgi:hypothetical protein
VEDPQTHQKVSLLIPEADQIAAAEEGKEDSPRSPGTDVDPPAGSSVDATATEKTSDASAAVSVAAAETEQTLSSDLTAEEKANDNDTKERADDSR